MNQKQEPTNPFAELDARLAAEQNLTASAAQIQQPKPQQGQEQGPSNPFAELDARLSQEQAMEDQGVKQSVGAKIPSAEGSDSLAGAFGSANPAGTDPGAFMAGVENFNRVFGSMAEGTIDLVARATGNNSLQQKVAQVKSNLDTSAASSAEQHPIAAGTGTALGMLGSAALPMGGTSGGYAARALTGAAGGSILGFLGTVGGMESRATNAAIGGLLGGTLAPLAKGISKVTEAVDGPTNSAINKSIFAKSSAEDAVMEVAKAKQGISNSIDDLVKGDVKSIDASVNEGMQRISHFNVDPNASQGILKDPLIAAKLQTSPLQNLEDTSFTKLTGISKSLTNDIFQGIGKEGSNTKELLQARNTLNNFLDEQGAAQGINYRPLRQMSEKKALYTQLTSALSKTEELPGMPSSMSGETNIQNIGIAKLFDTLAGTPEKQAVLSDSLQSAGIDPKNIQGMLGRLSELVSNPVDAAITANSSETGNILKSAIGGGSMTSRFVDYLTEGRYNSNILKLALSGPKLQEKLAQSLNEPQPTFVKTIKSLMIDANSSFEKVLKNSSMGGLSGAITTATNPGSLLSTK